MVPEIMEEMVLSVHSIVDKFISYINKYPSTLIESFCVVVPILFGVFYLKNTYFYLRIIFFYCLMLLVMDLPMWYLAIQGSNNYIWTNFQEIFSGIILIISFKYLKEKIPNKIIWLMTIFLVFGVIIGFKILVTSSLIFVINRIIYIILSFIFFYQLLNKLQIDNLLKYPPFWIISGLMMYACGTLLIFVFTEITISYNNDKEVFDLFTRINDSFKVVFMLLISVGFWSFGTKEI